MSRVFIGNIPHACTEQDLKEWIQSHGFAVESAEIVLDRSTGNSRGFGFVTLSAGSDLGAAIAVMNGRRLAGRVLTINEAFARSV